MVAPSAGRDNTARSWEKGPVLAALNIVCRAVNCKAVPGVGVGRDGTQGGIKTENTLVTTAVCFAERAVAEVVGQAQARAAWPGLDIGWP